MSLNKVGFFNRGLLFFSIFLYFFYPLVSSIFLLFLSGVFKEIYSRYFIYFLVSFSAGAVSYTKIPVTDLAVYYSYFNVIYGMSFFDVLISFNIDIAFYGISWAVIKIFNGDHRVVLVFWVTISYFLFFISADRLAKYFRVTRLVLVLLCVYLFFFGIPLSMVNHLVRQHVAYSFLFLSLTYLINSQNRNFCYAFLLAVFVHASMLLYLPLVFLVRYHGFHLSYSYNFGYKYILLIFSLLFALYFGTHDLTSVVRFFPDFGVGYISSLKLKFDGYNYVANFPFDVMFFLERFVFIAVGFILFFLSKKSSKDILFFNVFSCYVFYFLLFRGTDILFYRHFFMTSVFFSVAVFYILGKYNFFKYPFYFLIFIYAITSPLRFFRNISNSDGDYYIDGLDFFTTSLFGFFNI